MKPVHLAIVWSIGICIVFDFIVVYLFRSGIVARTRDERGELRKRMRFRDKMPILIFMLGIVGGILLYDISVIPAGTSLWGVGLWNFCMIIALVLYDSLIIDLLVIGVWRPPFLHLPDHYNMESMIRHVKKTFIVGWIFIIPLTVIPSVLYYYLIVAS